MKAVDQVRVAPRLQVFYLCDLVDPQAITRAIADQARTIRIPVHMIETINKTGAYQPAIGAGTRPRATSEEIAKRMDIPVSKVRKILKKSRRSPFRWRLQSVKKRIRTWGFHRGQGRGGRPPDAVINLNLEGADVFGVEDADAARREGHQDALWPGRRQRAYARGSGPVVRGHARAHPSD